MRSVDSRPPTMELVLTPLLAAPPPSLAFTGQRVTGSHFDSETSKVCKALVCAGILFFFFFLLFHCKIQHKIMSQRNKTLCHILSIPVLPKGDPNLLSCFTVSFYYTLMCPWTSCGSDGKESASDTGDLGSIPGSGRSPGEGNGYPLQYSFPENSTDIGPWWATVQGVAKSRTRLSNSHYYYCVSSGALVGVACLWLSGP